MFDLDPLPSLEDAEIEALTRAETDTWELETLAGAQIVPGHLVDWLPGPFLAVVLEAVDRDRLSEHDRVSVLQARHRLRAHIDADIYADMNSVFVAERAVDLDSDPKEDFDLASSEIAAALTLTRRAGDRELGFASSWPSIRESGKGSTKGESTTGKRGHWCRASVVSTPRLRPA